MIPYFGASVYDDPAVYAKSSAINFIKQAHTPTLVVVGDRDGECPAPQSFEFWHALRDQHVPTQLVVYPNEGHGFVNPAHRRDVMERAVEWFERIHAARRRTRLCARHCRFCSPSRPVESMKQGKAGAVPVSGRLRPDTLFFGANRACSVDRPDGRSVCRRPVARANCAGVQASAGHLAGRF